MRWNCTREPERVMRTARGQLQRAREAPDRLTPHSAQRVDRVVFPRAGRSVSRQKVCALHVVLRELDGQTDIAPGLEL
eukprot:799656-Alexandrium_andersonii.AAC.1